MKRIAILGSTGSIGTQALDIISKNRDKYTVTALSCADRIEELSKQIELFRPEMISVAREESARMLQGRFKGLEVYFGEEGLNTIAESNCDILLNSLMGIRGLEPTYRALKRGTDIAFANKETLVAGGDIIMRAARESGALMLPVDSEHSAIFQCLQGNLNTPVRRIILTASGGPFLGFNRKQLESVTPQMALKHPKWRMGKKISIDSATMMNKGLEVIEAKWLFDIYENNIDVAVHPQSIIHSMVEYEDSSIIAQLGLPDMRIPISYAFSYPNRLVSNDMPSLNFFETASKLTFEKPDTKTFRCLDLAYKAVSAGTAYTVVLNAANEILVEAFLEGRIGFIDIQENIERILNAARISSVESIDDIMALDRETRIDTKRIF
ncbi:MAG: 1-deoxy-D-xylulose-5-phosphate reductoisomerase [Eubacteriales bacterium]|nr:1-deoxy-D-xylulose-5-phosphate reductoisomerase [Eubacteriales bacterium]